MPWELEINHIDLTGTGDATLIIAREVGLLPGVAPRIRSVLIDGGRLGNGATVAAQVAMRILPANRLTAIIVTHYDADHAGGITWLLRQPAPLFSNVTIYDQGWAPSLSDVYTQYVRAINGLDNNGAIPGVATVGRTRVTARVQSDNMAPTMTMVTNTIGPPAVNGAINQAANWLLTAVAAPPDIFWGNGAIPGGAPTMSFIAANGYVRNPGGGVGGPYLGGTDPKNAKSLAVVVTFGQFRYYVGGDIETPQENYIQVLLNNNNNAAGRISAMKASHHGANTATSRAFVNQMRPDATFISCGTANSIIPPHPAQETINILDGYQPNPTGANPVPAHAAAPPAPPFRPARHYLTGYQVVAPPAPPGAPPGAPPPGPQSRAGVAGMTAGDPTVFPVVAGHIRLTVNAAQSASNRVGGRYLAVEAAANGAATAAGVVGALPPAVAGPAAAAAAEAAMSGGASAAANQFLTNLGVVGAAAPAGLAATNMINLGGNGAVVAQSVTLAAMIALATAAQAAGAGAAAGAVVGGVTGASIFAAVAGALVAGGVGIGPAGVAAAAAVPQGAPAVPGQFSLLFHNRGALVNPTTIVNV